MKKHIIAILLFICSLVLWIINFHNLPSQLPVHWDFSGHVNNYDSRMQTFIELYAIMLFVYLLPIVTPKIDQEKRIISYSREACTVWQQGYYLFSF